MKNKITLTLFLFLAFNAVKMFSQVTASIAASANPICNGSSSTFTGTPSGGTPPYTFSWSPASGLSSTTASVTTASPTVTTVYTLTVTDAATVTATSTVQLTVNANPTLTIGGGTTICSGQSTVLTGTGATTYTWVPGGVTSPTISVSPSSTTTYTLTGINASGCTATKTVTVNVSASPTLSVSGSSTICAGASANLMASGATTYTWNTGATTYSVAVTPTATTVYTVTGTSAGGCTATATGTITVSSQPTATISVTNVICNGMCNGSATVTPSGGAGGYTYMWAPSGATTASISSLCPGSFTATVTDAIGCTFTGTAVVTQPAAMTVNTTPTNASCGMCNGSVIANPSGGTPAYTYAWAPGGMTTQTASSLCAGIYSVSVTDANGCSSTSTVSINNIGGPTLAPTSNNTSCSACTGSAISNPSGGTPPYTFSWAPGGATTDTAFALCAGTYTATVTDNNGCITNTVVTVSLASSITTAPTSTNTTCYNTCDGSVIVNASGGTAPYTFTWTPGGAMADTAINLCGGNYTVNISDASGCTTTTVVMVGTPTPVSASIGGVSNLCQGQPGTLFTLASGGTPPYTYAWYDFNTIQQPSTIDTVIVSPFTWGIDSVKLVLTDANLCSDFFTHTITVNPGDSISGMVTDTNNVNVSSGLVYLFHQNPMHVSMVDTIGPVNINSGYYVFPNVGYGNYFIKVIADTNVYSTSIPTYYSIPPGAYQWDSAAVVTHNGCSGANISGYNVKIIQTPALAGPGQISGHISEGNGFGVRLGHGGGTPLGAPLKGVDIKLGRNPGGSPAARTTSDNNGDYQFNNIPVGNYRIYVDIPNYGMDSVLDISITPSNTVSTGNNYYVDSAMVRVDTCVVPAVTYTMVADATPSVWDVFPTYSLTANAVWYWGDGSSTAGMYPSHTYGTPGWYNICVTVFSSCGDSAQYCQNDTLYRLSHNSTNSVIQVNVVNGAIGVNDHQNSSADFEVYPNPAKNSLTVKAQRELGLITISNSLGQVVYKENVQSTQKQIDVSSLPPGVYIVNLQGRYSRIVKE